MQYPTDEVASLHQIKEIGIIYRLQASALEALQEATEMYIVQFFEDAELLTLHAKRVTLTRNDMILTRRLRGRNDIINR
ncbi:hypothetical protein EAI_01392 [Harpegnathos saltator]|uniref:Core Histone H2A/H2B/H3 domain-containing protein n=1 Tax=Harpegnathos saltator TaxID=610380 RepID=E2B7A3_HARSA|nr:hypothetical protein EAI_01392 [Harpegnathos saltator]